MSLEGNKKIAREFLEASLVADTARMGELMTDDATWWVMPSSLASGVQTKEDFLSFLPKFFANFDGPFAMRFDEITAEGDRVSVTTKGSVKLKNGNTYESDYHWLFIMRDGKILRVKEYGNTEHAVKVFTS